MGEQAYIGGGLAWARPEQSTQFLACRRAAKSLAPSIAAAENSMQCVALWPQHAAKGLPITRHVLICSIMCPLSCRQHCSCRIKAL